MKYGLLEDKIVPDEHYILGGHGSLGGEYLQPDGQWTSYLPSIESQLNPLGFDAMACVTFGTLNALEILANRVYGQTRNWSDRFLAKVSGTTPQGNSPHHVAETLRKQGVPNEIDYPYSPAIKTWAEFYADISSALKSLAIAFVNEFDFGHEWVAPQSDYLMEALKHSPLGISVPAWFKDENGLYYRPTGITDNHWVCLVGYKENEYWIVYDSYQQAGEGAESFVKKLRWDVRPSMVKRYSLLRQVNNEKGWLKYLIDLVLAAFGTKPTIPQNEVPKEEPKPKFKWDTPEGARHSVRVICDEEGLSVKDKNIITACIQQESQFDNGAVGINRNKKGVVLSTDWGIVQVNDTKGWHIGPGLRFPSVQYVIDNPEECVRWMVQMHKQGRLNLWSSFKSGAYKKYL